MGGRDVDKWTWPAVREAVKWPCREAARKEAQRDSICIVFIFCIDLCVLFGKAKLQENKIH